MALSDADKTAIRTTLGQFVENLKPNMCTFYTILITDYPQYHQYFPAVKDVKPADFGSNTYIRDTQGPKTGQAVADMVGKMDDAAALTAAVKGLVGAPQHTAIHLKKEDYGNAFAALLKTFQTALGDKLKPSDVEAWKKFVGIAMDLIGKNL